MTYVYLEPMQLRIERMDGTLIWMSFMYEGASLPYWGPEERLMGITLAYFYSSKGELIKGVILQNGVPVETMDWER